MFTRRSRSCPICGDETMSFGNRCLIEIGTVQRCRECGAAWRVSGKGRVLGLTLADIPAGAWFLVAIYQGVYFMAALAVSLWLLYVSLMPVAADMRDPLSKRAIRRRTPQATNPRHRSVPGRCCLRVAPRD